MNKSELIDAIAGKTGLSKVDTKKAVDGFIGSVSASLKKGEKVTLVGFGSFVVKKRAAREGRHPQTGKKINIPAKKVVRFRAGGELKVK